jgi:hypothetical protein
MAERGRLSRFVQRWPFASAFMAAFVAALVVGAAAREQRWDAESDAMLWLSFAGQALALLLPAVVAVRWKGAGRRARANALAVCALWWMFESNRVAGAARDLREFIPNVRVVAEMVREPRAAMEQEASIWAEKALAAGDTSFLVTGGTCGNLHGVDTVLARRHGVRVIRGTYHDGPRLTPGHREYIWTAYDFASRYNEAVLDRIGAEAQYYTSCQDHATMRGRAPFFWP